MLKNRIKELRDARGLTQEELAVMVSPIRGKETAHATIGRLERGIMELDVDWIEWIAKALKCDPRELIGGKEQDNDSLHPVSRELLENILVSLDDYLHQINKMLTSHAKAKAIAIIYNEQIKEGEVRHPTESEIALTINAMLD